MSGFFVSNSFGTFQSESKTKKFNASIIGVPGAPATATFPQFLKNDAALNLPNITKPIKWGQTDMDSGWWSRGVKMEEDNDGHLDSWAPGAPSDLTPDVVNNFFKWANGTWATQGNDYWLLLYPGDAFHWKASPKTTVKFQVRYVTDNRDSGDQDAYDYVVNIKKGGNTSGQSVPAACNDSAVSCFSNYDRNDSSGYAQFDVEMTGDDYMSIDVGRDNSSAGASSSIHASRFRTQCGQWERHDDNEPQDKGMQRVQVLLKSVTWNPVEGCTDPKADNTETDATVDDGSCTYTTSTISSFTATPTTTTFGEGDVKLKWVLSNDKFSKVKILHNGSDINTKPSAQDSDIYTSPTSVGGNDYELEVTWNKPNAQTRRQTVSVNAVAPASYITCDPLDINRNVDANGECGECKTGFSMIDATTGFCTNCEATNDDPYRSMNTDGTCGDCMAGYAEHTDGTCQKVGCITYADGTSAEDDYNYDPDAVTNDSSLCEGPGDPDIVPEAIDCEVSDWSDWSEWSDAATLSGTRTRTRTVVTAQSGGGAECPDLTETETGVVDPNTGTVTITTQGGDTQPVEPTTETKSLAAPLIIGGIVLTIGYLVMRR